MSCSPFGVFQTVCACVCARTRVHACLACMCGSASVLRQVRSIAMEGFKTLCKQVCQERRAQWQEENNSDCAGHVMSFFAKTPTKIAAGPFQEPLPKHTSSGKVDQCAIERWCLSLEFRHAGFCSLKLAGSGLPQSWVWEACVVAEPQFQITPRIQPSLHQ